MATQGRVRPWQLASTGHVVNYSRYPTTVAARHFPSEMQLRMCSQVHIESLQIATLGVGQPCVFRRLESLPAYTKENVFLVATFVVHNGLGFSLVFVHLSDPDRVGTFTHNKLLKAGDMIVHQLESCQVLAGIQVGSRP